MQDLGTEPRKIDQLMACYVRIGGILGVMLAVLVFMLICGVFYYMLFAASFGHNYILLGIILTAITLLLASMAALCVFFWASVMWLPILIGIAILILFAWPLWERLHHFS